MSGSASANESFPSPIIPLDDEEVADDVPDADDAELDADEDDELDADDDDELVADEALEPVLDEALLDVDVVVEDAPPAPPAPPVALSSPHAVTARAEPATTEHAAHLIQAVVLMG
jgi:hypothetical protein